MICCFLKIFTLQSDELFYEYQKYMQHIEFILWLYCPRVNLIEVICSNMNSACVSKNTFQNIITYQ